MRERTSLLRHLLTSLFTSSLSPSFPPSTNLDPLRAQLERRLPACACQSPDSKVALVRALVPAARHVLTAEHCYSSSATASAAASAGAAAVATGGPDAAKSLVHCVLGLLLLPLAPGSDSSAAESAPPSEDRPGSQASSRNDADLHPTENGQDGKDPHGDTDEQSQIDAPGQSSKPPSQAPQDGVEGDLKNAPEAWVYELLLWGLQEAAVCSPVIKALKLDKYIRQLLKAMRAESVPLHALTVPQARQLQVLSRLPSDMLSRINSTLACCCLQCLSI